MSLDKTDQKILALLQLDGRRSNQDIAEQVNLSPSPCLRRIKHLEESGIITQYVGLIDPQKIGLGLLAYVNVRMEKQPGMLTTRSGSFRTTSPREDFSASVAQWPEVVACYAMTGDADYLMRIHVKDMEHFSRFVMETLLRHPAVLDVRSSFALQRIKETTALPLSPELFL